MTDDALPRPRPWFVRQDWFFAVALACFVGVGVWFGRAIQDFLTPPTESVAAPTLVGETLEDAISTARQTHMTIGAVRRTESDRYPRDVVMRQDPAAGAQIRPGRRISLVVSNGVSFFPMPDLRYESRRQLGLDLSRSKLALGRVRVVASDDAPADTVVSQDPAPLSSVRAGMVVNVEISKGGPSGILVPDFLSDTIDDARSRAADAKVRFGQIVWTPFGRYGPPRGTIVRQLPRPGTELDPSESVSLQVSAGPRESGYLIRQVHATITVPEDAAKSGDKSSSVRVGVRDETGTWNVYNAFAEPKQRLDFNLTVVGTSELDVFVNGELVDSTKLGVEPPIQERQTLGPKPPNSKRPKNLLPQDLRK